VHAHFNLLGWVTMGMFGFFYRLWPEAAESRLAKLHFWIYVPAHFIQMAALYAFYSGLAAIEPLLGAVSVVVALAIVLFGYIAWKYTGVTGDQTKRASAVTGLTAH
jgi:predicted permease